MSETLHSKPDSGLRLGALLFLVGFASVLPAFAQGTVKFELYGRYDTVLTSSDTALLKMTVIEFHRKFALAGYATYYWRDPTFLAKYVDVSAETIETTSDSVRMVLLNQIFAEIELARDPATSDRIILHQIKVHSDTLAELIGYSPFLSVESEAGKPDQVTYTLRRAPGSSRWWVCSTSSSEGRIAYHNYLDLPDEKLPER